LSGVLKRFVDSLRNLFSSPGNNDPLDKMSDIEPRAFNDSLESENMYPLGTNMEMEQEVEA
jgi:hypothetical protein